MTAPTSFVDNYLPALLAQASALISGEFHDVVNRQGFTVSEWRVLATLSDGSLMSIGQLAAVATMKQPTMTRVLDRMATKGQIERVQSEQDRRVTWVRITRLGKRTVQRLIPLAQAHEARVLEPFGLKRADELKATLRSIVELHRGSTPASDDSDDD